MSEIIETRNGYRAVVHIDENSSDMRPDGDFFGYVFSADGRNATLLGKAYSTPEEDFGLIELWNRYMDWDDIRTALTTDPEYAAYGVVDLDWISGGRDIVNIVTSADLKIWGWDENPDNWPHAEDGHKLRPCENNLVEWEAWANGDVWYYTIEKLVHWTSDDSDVSDRDTWEEVSSCAGFYGEEYAAQSAREELAAFAGE